MKGLRASELQGSWSKASMALGVEGVERPAETVVYRGHIRGAECCVSFRPADIRVDKGGCRDLVSAEASGKGEEALG